MFFFYCQRQDKRVLLPTKVVYISSLLPTPQTIIKEVNHNLGQNSLGKCDALICLCDKAEFLPTLPPPPIPMLVKKRAKACTVWFASHCQHWFGEWGERTNILCKCMSNDAYARIFPESFLQDYS